MSEIPIGVTTFFVVIVLVLAVAFVLATWRAGQVLGETLTVTWRWTIGTAGFVSLWLAATAILAAQGRLADWSTLPPPMIKLVATAGLLTFFYAFSRIGWRLVNGLSVASLVGFQVFRVPVELVLLWLYRAGVVPVQMTFEGLNFDVLSGVSAPLVAWLVATNRLATRGVFLWNLVGLGLLINIVTIAILSTPLPFRVFLNEPANTFITQAPYVWLPVFLVQAALFGHLLVFRRLWRTA
jgi:hypothetical protein